VAVSSRRRVILAHGSQGRWCEATGRLTVEDARDADLERLAELVYAYPVQARELVARLRR
jgi:hypothetical protein